MFEVQPCEYSAHVRVIVHGQDRAPVISRMTLAILTYCSIPNGTPYPSVSQYGGPIMGPVVPVHANPPVELFNVRAGQTKVCGRQRILQTHQVEPRRRRRGRPEGTSRHATTEAVLLKV